MLLLVDNYDSFTYNLAQVLGALGTTIVVRRNDELTLADVERLSPERIVISPGPGRPERAGLSPDIIRRFGPSIPVLGVCLGHQAIATVYGGHVVRLAVPVHGKASRIGHDGQGVFLGLQQAIDVGRYHSLVVSDAGLPDCLDVAARAPDDGAIMGIRHRTLPVHGVQFHPESVLTPTGRDLLASFLAHG